nr:unnamed protein product [Callosobruchus analis]
MLYHQKYMNGIPLRPIVSTIQSPFSKLAKYLKDILNNIINKNPSYIKDSWHFKEKIKNINIPNNYKIISLDVVSLYTNVPIDLALRIIETKWNDIEQYTSIPLNDFKEAVEMTLNSTYFIFQDKFYKQIYGCAMGSSLSSCIAQLVLEDLENQVIPNLNCPLPFFFRYVDDCLTAIPNDKDNYILEQFHSYHPKLKFTIEIEKYSKINFLDLTIHHNNNKMYTAWYTKDTWSGRYLNYYSQHPITQKKSVITGLADRAIKLSDQQYREAAINKAKNILKQNCYPSKLINSIFKSRIHTFYNNLSKNKNNKNTNQKYLTIPYIPNLSENIQKILKPHNIPTSYKAHNLLQKTFSKLKTKTEKNKMTHIVYKIPCNNCNSSYIGQTSQHLENRIKGHKYDKKIKQHYPNMK